MLRNFSLLTSKSYSLHDYLINMMRLMLFSVHCYMTLRQNVVIVNREPVISVVNPTFRLTVNTKEWLLIR